MAAVPPSVDSLGSISSKSIRASAVNAGLADGGTSANLSLTAYNPLDASQFTSIILSNDGTTSTVALANDAGGTVSLGGVGLPQSGTDAANKDYVDALAQGISAKNSAYALMTGNFVPDVSDAQTIAISTATVFAGDVVVFEEGSVTFNGVVIPGLGDPITFEPLNTLNPEFRVLLTFGGVASVRAGVYCVTTTTSTSAVLVRCADMNSGDAVNEIKVGTYIFAGGSNGYVISAMGFTPGVGFVLGTDTITMTQFNAPGTYTGSGLVSVDAGARSISISSSARRGLLLASTTALTEPSYTSVIGPENTAAIAGDPANLLTIRDPGAHDGTINAGGLIIDGPASWPGDATTTGQAIYHGKPTAVGSMRSTLKSSGTLNSPLLHVERWDGAAWSSVFAIGQ